MDTQDFRRCYSCKAIMPQRSGGLCENCNPHPDPEPCPESMDEDYDWSAKEIDHRGPDPEDYEDNGEPIPGTYILSTGGHHEIQLTFSPCIACQGLPSECIPCGCPEVQRDTTPDHECIPEMCPDCNPWPDPEDMCPCGDPDCTAMFDLPENEADHHGEPCESLNEKTHAPCEGVDKIVMAGCRG